MEKTKYEILKHLNDWKEYVKNNHEKNEKMPKECDNHYIFRNDGDGNFIKFKKIDEKLPKTEEELIEEVQKLCNNVSENKIREVLSIPHKDLWKDKTNLDHNKSTEIYARYLMEKIDINNEELNKYFNDLLNNLKDLITQINSGKRMKMGLYNGINANSALLGIISYFNTLRNFNILDYNDAKLKKIDDGFEGIGKSRCIELFSFYNLNNFNVLIWNSKTNPLFEIVDSNKHKINNIKEYIECGKKEFQKYDKLYGESYWDKNKEMTLQLTNLKYSPEDAKLMLRKMEMDKFWHYLSQMKSDKLAKPFCDIFKDRNEANEIFDIFKTTLDKLNIKDPNNKIFSVTLPNYKKVCLNYCCIRILRIKKDSIELILKNSEVNKLNINEQEGEFVNMKGFSLYDFSMEEFNNQDEEILNIFNERLNEIEKELNYEACNQRRHNKPQITEAIMNEEKREKLFLEGFPEEEINERDEKLDELVKNYVKYVNDKYPDLLNGKKHIEEEGYKWEIMKNANSQFNKGNVENLNDIDFQKVAKHPNFQEGSLGSWQILDNLNNLKKNNYDKLYNHLKTLFDNTLEERDRINSFVEGSNSDLRTASFLLASAYPLEFPLYKYTEYKKLIDWLGEEKIKTGKNAQIYLEYRDFCKKIAKKLKKYFWFKEKNKEYANKYGFNDENFLLWTYDLVYIAGRENESLISKCEVKEMKINNNVESDKKINVPLNQIFYGPPGTGKTYDAIIQALGIAEGKELEKVKDGGYKIVLTDDEIKKFKKKYFSKTDDSDKNEIDYKTLSWKDALVIAIGKEGYIKVPQLINDEVIIGLINAKNRAKNIKSTLWSVLQTNSKINSETVNLSKKNNSELFDKTSDSQWYLTTNGKEYYEEVFKDQEINKLSINDRQIEIITFHPSYDYVDFIEGIVPIIDDSDDKLRYGYKDGILKEMSKKALYSALPEDVKKVTYAEEWDTVYKAYKKCHKDEMKWEENQHLLIIDEINRGDLSRIFGETITLIEDSKRLGKDDKLTIKLPYTGDEFGIPKNLYIIGTMNTADKSISHFDVALRRRFTFHRYDPNFDLEKYTFIERCDKEFISNINKLNEKLEHEPLIGPEKQIGHTYFMDNDEHSKTLEKIIKFQIYPLLEDYFVYDKKKLEKFISKLENYSCKNTKTRDHYIDGLISWLKSDNSNKKESNSGENKNDETQDNK